MTGRIRPVGRHERRRAAGGRGRHRPVAGSAPALALAAAVAVALGGCGTTPVSPDGLVKPAAASDDAAGPEGATPVGATVDGATPTSDGSALVAAAPDPGADLEAVPEVAVTGALAATAPAARPTRLEVPALGLGRGLITLGLDPSGALEVPSDPADAGWYELSAQPGDPGPAVVAGHVDSREGPAVFHRLRELQTGDEVRLTRGDGRVASFRVDRVEQHPKDAFPTEAVYGPTPTAELRLITCGGEFDRASSHYRDNVVVFAHLA